MGGTNTFSLKMSLTSFTSNLLGIAGSSNKRYRQTMGGRKRKWARLIEKRGGTKSLTEAFGNSDIYPFIKQNCISVHHTGGGQVKNLLICLMNGRQVCKQKTSEKKWEVYPLEKTSFGDDETAESASFGDDFSLLLGMIFLYLYWLLLVIINL